MGNASGSTQRRSSAAYLGVGINVWGLVHNIGRARRHSPLFNPDPVAMAQVSVTIDQQINFPCKLVLESPVWYFDGGHSSARSRSL